MHAEHTCRRPGRPITSRMCYWRSIVRPPSREWNAEKLHSKYHYWASTCISGMYSLLNWRLSLFTSKAVQVHYHPGDIRRPKLHFFHLRSNQSLLVTYLVDTKDDYSLVVVSADQRSGVCVPLKLHTGSEIWSMPTGALTVVSLYINTSKFNLQVQGRLQISCRNLWSLSHIPTSRY